VRPLAITSGGAAGRVQRLRLHTRAAQSFAMVSFFFSVKSSSRIHIVAKRRG